MSGFYYSAKTNGAYPQNDIEIFKATGTWPDDAVLMSAEVFSEFFSELPPAGKIRIAGPDGLPAWADIPPPSDDQLLAMAEAEKQSRIADANDYMNSKQWPGKAAMGRLKVSEKAQYNLWLDYLDLLEAVDTSTVPDKWPVAPE